MMGVDLYCGINETKWNHHPVAPGPLACVAPVYGATARTKKENVVVIPENTIVIEDSGAFSDGPGQRLSFNAALMRQKEHSLKYGYGDRVSHIASYDLLIDEKWLDGKRFKRRWTPSEAEGAVEETIAAARFLVGKRDNKRFVLSAQGVVAEQYLDCVKRIVPLLEEGDILGLGGWCIIGKMPRKMMPVFRETICKVIPFVADSGVEWIHIWGVIFAPALGELLWLCNKFGIKLSTDSAGPTWRPAFGLWGYADWVDRTYLRAPVETRGLDRAKHVQCTREWLERLEETQYYQQPIVVKQLSFM